MLIMPGTNKLACPFTMKTRNGRPARNILRFLPSLSPRRTCTFTPHAMFILAPLFSIRASPLRRRLSDPSLIYLPRCIQSQRFVYVAICLFRPHKYLTPLWKSQLHAGNRIRYRLIPIQRALHPAVVTVNLTNSLGHRISHIFTFYRSSPREPERSEVVTRAARSRGNCARSDRHGDCTLFVLPASPPSEDTLTSHRGGLVEIIRSSEARFAVEMGNQNVKSCFDIRDRSSCPPRGQTRPRRRNSFWQVRCSSERCEIKGRLSARALLFDG
jgi:hypothetical protein